MLLSSTLSLMSSRASRQSFTPWIMVSSISPLPTIKTGSMVFALPRRMARCLLVSIIVSPLICSLFLFSIKFSLRTTSQSASQTRPGCGTQHPLRSACVLLAAAPTMTPCFRHWRRSSLLPLVGEPLAKRRSFTKCQSLPSVGEVALRSNDGEVNFPPKTPAAPSPSPPAHFRGG